jgi:hypothetical protein
MIYVRIPITLTINQFKRCCKYFHRHTERDMGVIVKQALLNVLRDQPIGMKRPANDNVHRSKRRFKDSQMRFDF